MNNVTTSEKQVRPNGTYSLYAVVNTDKKYFAGFNTQTNKPNFVDQIDQGAKLFSNKFDIKLRPNESVVEVMVPLRADLISVSEPFRPRRKKVEKKEA